MKHSKSKALALIDRLNVASHVSHHLFGENHSKTHRKIFGSIIAAIGVSIAYGSAASGIHLLHFVGEYVGFAIHGIGFIPFVHEMEEGGKHE